MGPCVHVAWGRNPRYRRESRCETDGLEPPAPVEAPYDSDATPLPKNLGEAIDTFAGSAFYRSQLGAEFVDYLTTLKRAEWQRYLSAVSQWEQDEYFDLF